jgi:hypothetical protein
MPASGFQTLARETLSKVTTEVDPSAVSYLAGIIKRLSKGKTPELANAPQADIAEREHTPSISGDPLAAARARGRRYALDQYESPDNLALLEARDYAGRNERAINEMRQSGQLYALLPPGKTRGFRYPKWQFDADADRLEAVLRPFVQADANCWVIHSFMMGKREVLDGRSPAETILNDMLDLKPVIDLAESDLASEQGAR